jgi:hypothetical protein
MPAQVAMPGGSKVGLMNQSDSSARIYDATTYAYVALPNSGEVYISGTYEINQPVETL